MMYEPSEHDLRHGSISVDEEDIEDWEAAQEAAKILTSIKREVTPARVAMAGAVFFMLITLVASGWYWLLSLIHI